MQEWLFAVFSRTQEASAWFIGVVIIGVLVAVIVALIRSLESRADVGGSTEMERLNKHDAGGKISIEKYEERKQRAARAG